MQYMEKHEMQFEVLSATLGIFALVKVDAESNQVSRPNYHL